jgi:UDP-N-acetylmuramyl pentapeptide phosphotransferase/UDP-N-acetylglucosamine-1-phosphate transferase
LTTPLIPLIIIGILDDRQGVPALIRYLAQFSCACIALAYFGLDGIVAGCSAVEIGFLAIYLNQPLLWLLVAALIGFLWWNWSPAKIFMGDAGSTFLGATIALALFNNHGNAGAAWSALAIVLPLMGDAIYTLVRRLLRRENLFQAHRSHLYQRLQQSGWTHAQVASTYIVVNLLIAGSISYLGELGAWLSLGGVIIAIILGEIYLQSSQMQEQL